MSSSDNGSQINLINISRSKHINKTVTATSGQLRWQKKKTVKVVLATHCYKLVSHPPTI